MQRSTARAGMPALVPGWQACSTRERSLRSVHLNDSSTSLGSESCTLGPMACPQGHRPPPAAHSRPGCHSFGQLQLRGMNQLRLAALPADALGELPTAAAAAAAASLLTAAWLRQGDGSGASQARQPPAYDGEQPTGVAAAATDENPEAQPVSAEAIWAAAWRGFADRPGQPQQAEPRDAAAGREGSAAQGLGDVDGGSPEQGQGQEDGAAPGSEEASALQRTPLLLLQGIRASERARLLALCLAALEAQMTVLPPGAIMLGGAAQWRQLTAALLVLSSLVAASTWLGYVPTQLLEAAAGRLSGVEPAVLQAAGLEGAAAALQRQAAASMAVAGADKEESGSSGSDVSAGDGSGDDGTGTAVGWYCLDDKVQLYSSVLRLLTCSFADAQQAQQAQHGPQGRAARQHAAAGPAGAQAQSPGLPAVSAALAAGSSQQHAQPAAAAAAATDAQHPDIALAGASTSIANGGGSLARQQALVLLKQQKEGSLANEIRGWRATSAGTRSETQLLALAPAVLQDMAVTAADAVAAAYLTDAAAAGPNLAAARAAAEAAEAAAAPAGPQEAASAAVEAEAEAEAEGRVQAQGAGQAQAAAQPRAPTGEDAGRAADQRQGRQQRQRQRPSAGLGAWLPRPVSARVGAASASSSDRSRGGSAGSGAGGSSGGNPLEAGWWPTFVHAQLGSTRQLQRFTNAVALNRWVQRQYRGVADIYEDRLRLYCIAEGGTRLQPRTAPMKRTPELSKLKGLRYAASLLLEAADLLLPLLRTLWRQATTALSWLLVRLVGQAVALVRRGVQQGSAAAAAAATRPSTSRQQRQGHQVGRQQQGQQQEQRQPRGGSGGSRSGRNEPPGPASACGWAWQV